MANEKKITYSEALDYVLANCEMPEGYAERIRALKAQTDKKNSAKSAKVSEEQNAVIAEIVAVMGDKPMTITEICKALDNKYANQRVSAYIKKLVESGQVVRTEDKRKAYFALA